MNKVLYKNSEHTILYKDKKCKIMYKDKPYQDEELDYPSIVLCHFEDDFVGGQITDAKGNVFTKSGNVYITTTKSKFGNKSLYMENPSYLFSEVINSLSFGTGNFTIDFWVNSNQTGRGTIFALYNGGIYIDILSLQPRMWFSNPTSGWKVDGEGTGRGTISMISNMWNHVALVRDGEYLTLYVNGMQSVRIKIGTVAQRDFGNLQCYLGAWQPINYYYTGYIDELRITDKAIWTGEFTPPTKPYNN